jgi:aspartate carbamoyltransferase catalytic subunit
MHLLSIRELPKEDIETLLKLSLEMKTAWQKQQPLPSFAGKVVGMMFMENSTRTRVSFEQAARRLRLDTCTFGVMGSSMRKGESLKDTVLTLMHEGIDALVIRHHCSGAPYLAARCFHGPVINAGDGMHEHPTQALTDGMTILERKGKINGLKVAIVGDVLHSRVARSNMWLLSKMGADVHLVGPRTLMPRLAGRLPATLHYDLFPALEGADVVMALRLQKERMGQGLISSLGEYASMYQINQRTIRFAAEDCLVMHPGPMNRGLEFDDRVPDGPQSVIHQQVENGVYVKMAVFTWLFEGSEAKHEVAV